MGYAGGSTLEHGGTPRTTVSLPSGVHDRHGCGTHCGDDSQRHRHFVCVTVTDATKAKATMATSTANPSMSNEWSAGSERSPGGRTRRGVTET